MCRHGHETSCADEFVDGVAPWEFSLFRPDTKTCPVALNEPRADGGLGS